jgi:hypothetical protein
MKFSTTYDSMIYCGKGALWTHQQIDRWISKIQEDDDVLIWATELDVRLIQAILLIVSITSPTFHFFRYIRENIAM